MLAKGVRWLLVASSQRPDTVLDRGQLRIVAIWSLCCDRQWDAVIATKLPLSGPAL
jgi:hypothetical protein